MCRKILKIISLVLINCFLVLDFAWAGGLGTYTVNPDKMMLSAPLRISGQEFCQGFYEFYAKKFSVADVWQAQTDKPQPMFRNKKEAFQAISLLIVLNVSVIMPVICGIYKLMIGSYPQAYVVGSVYLGTAGGLLTH